MFIDFGKLIAERLTSLTICLRAAYPLRITAVAGGSRTLHFRPFSWTSFAVPSTYGMSAVSCPTVDRCCGCGRLRHDSHQHGRRCNVDNRQQGPSSPYWGLNGISCPTADRCVAVAGRAIAAACSKRTQSCLRGPVRHVDADRCWNQHELESVSARQVCVWPSVAILHRTANRARARYSTAWTAVAAGKVRIGSLARISQRKLSEPASLHRSRRTRHRPS